MEECTSFFCLWVRGFPDFVSSGGGIGGAGTRREDEAFSADSTSGSRIDDGPSNRDPPRSKYVGGNFPKSKGGNALLWPAKSDGGVKQVY